MVKKLVIVESPAKAKTIKKYLGNGYTVVASNGHVRDLPKSTLGVDTENGFEPRYINIRGKGDLIANLKKEVKKADFVYLATDPDREGEAISWHLTEVLGLAEKKHARITFNEITKSAIQSSIKNARDISLPLVDAQQARRVLDRIAGYEMSPVLWKKVKKGLSAGRVQSAALKLLCDREEEIEEFMPEEFWKIEAEFPFEGAALSAHLAEIRGEKAKIETAAEAEAAQAALERIGQGTITAIKRGTRIRKAPDPFITSTLQQEASKRLNMSPAKTMAAAQRLYEGVEVSGRGTVALISYLRTDSVRISDEAQAAAAAFITEKYGEKFVGEKPSDSKKAGLIQDAHEAIRPTDVTILPDELKNMSERDVQGRDLYRLYKLIWERFLASRMKGAEYETYQVEIACTDAKDSFGFVSAGSRLTFKGFMAVYKEEEEEAEEDFRDIKHLAEGAAAPITAIAPTRHFTQAPPHYNEASLIRTMQENGIGRPSTYSPIISTLLARGYVAKDKKNLLVTELGDAVNRITAQYFEELTDSGFTAGMEQRLDEVAEGKLAWKDVVRDFYEGFEPCVKTAMEEAEKVRIQDPVTDIICEKCGRPMLLKLGKHGKFFACSGFPDCHNTLSYYEKTGSPCPVCGKEIYQRIAAKTGKPYFRCSDPDCEFWFYDLPTTEVCPECGKRLYLKRGRKLYCPKEKEGCGYQKAVEEE